MSHEGWRAWPGAGALAVLISVGVGACGAPDSPFLGSWQDDEGALSRDELQLHRGEDHCEWAAAVFLRVAWPPGTAGRHQFVRDPKGVVSAELSAGFVGDAALPADAVRTGYRNESGVQLWLPSGDDLEQAYLVTSPDDVEAWPLADPPMGCD
jgi:hypothetical protein